MLSFKRRRGDIAGGAEASQLCENIEKNIAKSVTEGGVGEKVLPIAPTNILKRNDLKIDDYRRKRKGKPI